MQLAGKTVLITGASQGLGAATAQAMAARGAEVLLLARSEDKLRDVAAVIEKTGGRARTHPVDLSDLPAVEATTDAIKAQGPAPDVIVNNAGIGRWLFIEETSLEEMQAIMAVPFFAAFAVTKAFISEMAQRGSGNICNINGPGALVSVARVGGLFVGAVGPARLFLRTSKRHARHRGDRHGCLHVQDCQ